MFRLQSCKNKEKIDWQKKEKYFKRLIESYKSKKNYDCIIPVSGGKDSYYQTHLIKKVYGLNPLLVTYNGNNYSRQGLENLQNMREVFGVDHIFYSKYRCFKIFEQNGHANDG